MKSWSVSIQLNGDEVSKFYDDIRFRVPEKLYVKMQTAIKRGIPLSKCPFYKELEKRADEAIDDYVNDELREEAFGPMPERKNFNSKEAYEDALEEYYCSDSIGNYCIVDYNIFDPGYEAVFKARFIGRKYEDYEEDGPTEAEYEYQDYDEICATYYITVCFDGDGVITDLKDISGEAMESEDVKGSTWGSCEPDYDFIAECLEEDLFSDEDEDDDE